MKNKRSVAFALALLFYATILPPLSMGADFLNYNIRNLVVKESPYVDVLSYMDGLSGRNTLAAWRADNTIAVTAAIQAALDSGKKRVYLPTGNYKTTSELTRPPGVKFFGDGPAFSVIVASHNGVIISTTPATLTGDSYNSIEDIGFKNAPGYNSSIAISLGNLNQASVKRVRITDGPSIGLQLVFVLNSVFEQISTDNCTDTALYIYSASNAAGNNRNIYKVINIIYGGVGINISGTGTYLSVFEDVAVEATTGFPVDILAGSKIIFNRLYLEGNAATVRIRGGDDITFRDTFNVSNQQFLSFSGAGGTSVLVDRLYDGGGGVLDNANIMYLRQGQIQFPSTQVSSANANTLDDYKEGVWTIGDSSGAGLTLTNADNTYTKIGRTVFLNFNITFPSTADGSQIYIGGLPYTSSGAGSVSVSYTTESTLVRGATVDGASYFTFYNSSGTPIVNSTMSGKIVRGTITYRTD